MSKPILRTLRLVQQTRPILRTTPLFTHAHPRATLSTLPFSRRQPRPSTSTPYTTISKRHTSSQTQSPQEPTSQPLGKLDQPSYSLTFTCRPCSTRSTHTVTKQAYHSGTVLIQCPECKNRHLIADHLKIFSDKRITLEDILGAKGEAVKYGVVSGGEEGDLEVLPGKEGAKGE